MHASAWPRSSSPGATRPGRGCQRSPAARPRRGAWRPGASVVRSSVDAPGATGTERDGGAMTAASDDILPELPPRVPRVKPNRFTRWFGRSILRLGGWRLVGEFPDEPRVVLIGAPHTSNWDGIWGMAAKIGLGLEIRILGKQELFWW